jgi:hypothetical protein
MNDDIGGAERMARRRDRDRHSGLVGGLVLITVGALFLLDQMRWGFGWRFSELWPLILVVIGLASLARHRGRRWGGLWVVLVGVMLLLDQMRVMSMDRSWPLFVVGGGLSLIFGGPRRRRTDEEGGTDV